MKTGKTIGATLACLAALCAFASVAGAEETRPAWKLVAAMGPTNLPPIQSEVQRVTERAQGGEFTLSFGSQTTGALPYDAGAAEVQSALEALSALGAGSVTVRGGPGGNAEDPYFIAFGGPLADQDVAQLSADGSLLSGEGSYAAVSTTVPGGAGTGEIGIFAVNVGAAPSLGEVTVHLGPLPEGIVTAGAAKGSNNSDWVCTTEERELTCEGRQTVVARSQAKVIGVPVEATTRTPFNSSVPVEISGGGAMAPATYQLPLTVSRERARPGTAAFWAGAFGEDGTPAHQAGAHPPSAFTYFVLNTVRTHAGQIVPAGLAKDIRVDIPPGFLGNPMVTAARCPQSSILCSDEDTWIGSLYTSTNFALPQPGTAGVDREDAFRNDVPVFGSAAQFTTKVASPLATLLGSVRSEEDFGIRIESPHSASTFQKLFKTFAVLEGTPKAADGKAFLTLQSDCAEEAREQRVVKARFNTWQEPESYFYGETLQPPVTGCDKLEFKAYDKKTKEGQVSFGFQPTSTQGSSPVGATAHLHIDQAGLTDPDKLATPDLKKAIVTLPAGLALNPSQAAGLEACSEAQVGLKTTTGGLPNPIRFSEDPVSCPDGSKLGTVEAVSPLLEEPLQGTIYLAAQEENPFGSLIAIYLVLESPRFGITIKLPGRVDPDPVTGQLTATFDYNPQQPVEDLTLHFRGGGPRSEFATPEVCGTYTTTGSWEPWSAPESGPPAQTTDSFEVQEGCMESAAERFFEPSFEVGTTGTQAGSYAPLVIKLNRKDGEQELRSLDFSLPAGVSGKLAGIPYCPDAAIDVAAGRSGRQELASPSCPAASQIGTVDTAAGVGSQPFHVGGKVYLAGPYRGAPVSSVVITPAVAGPFDLGNVVVRAPLYVNPETAVLTAKSDPIPTILRGIQLKVRSVVIDVDRPGFIINPTNCTPMTATALLGGSNGATERARNRFQVGGCENLRFKPKLQVRLKGGTRRNANPALIATLRPAPGQANIAFTSVALPHSEFLEQGHIKTICTRVQFAAQQCPKGSIYGRAEAVTPLLDQPLRGPVYLRSSSHRLPDMVVALRGPATQPIEVDLDGRIDSVHGGIRTTFETVPDAPVSKFVLRMQGGKKSLLVNSTNICRRVHRNTVKMTGQNGQQHNFRPPLKAQCGKHAKKHKRHHKKHRRHGNRKRGKK